MVCAGEIRGQRRPLRVQAPASSHLCLWFCKGAGGGVPSAAWLLGFGERSVSHHGVSVFSLQISMSV